MTQVWADSPALHRRFRRLLIAYPRGYRHRYGDEILTTLMDAAGTGRERPTAAEARDLVVGGLRQRFRLPVGRLMVVAALLTALTVGALGAALGSAAAWATAADVPNNDRVRSLVGLAVGEPYQDPLVREHQRLQPSASAVPSQHIGGWTPAAAEARFAAAGWALDPYQGRLELDSHVIGTEKVPTEVTSMVAERDGLLIQVLASTFRGGPAEFRDRTHLLVLVRPAEPATTLPLVLAGGLLGLAAGWLLAARVGYRLRRLSLPRRLALVAVAAGAAAVLAPLTVGTFRLVIEAIAAAAGPGPTADTRFDVMPAFWQYSYYLQHGWNAATGLVAALLVVILAVALRPAPPGAAEPEPAGS